MSALGRKLPSRKPAIKVCFQYEHNIPKIPANVSDAAIVAVHTQ
jgi:hypothetical protein